jgi:O-antigen ligase
MTGRQGRGVLEAGFLACLFAAAIAFGGTQPLVWAVIQFTIFTFTAAALWILPEPIATLPWKWLGLFAVFLVAQAFALQARGEGVNEPLADFLVYVAAFALSAALAAAPGARTRLVAALITLGVAEAVYGLAQELAGWQQILGIEKLYYRAQATGTYVNPNHFAGLLEMILPLALAAAAWRWQRAESGEGEDGRAAALFFAALALLIAAGIFVSHSRMGLMSAAAGAALAAGVWTFSTHGRPRRMRAASLAAALVAAALLALWIGPEPVVERFRLMANESHSRFELWRESAALIRARPLAGAGWGAYPHLYPQVQATELEFVVEHAHNDYLELATEFGLPGAALLVALAAGIVLRALALVWRGLEGREAFHALGAASGIAALGIHSFADFNLHLPANALIFSALLGLAWAAATPPANTAPRTAQDARVRLLQEKEGRG